VTDCAFINGFLLGLKLVFMRSHPILLQAMNEAEDVSDLWQKPAKEMSHLVDHLSSAKKARNST